MYDDQDRFRPDIRKLRFLLGRAYQSINHLLAIITWGKTRLRLSVVCLCVT